jgi:hypothetical protein
MGVETGHILGEISEDEARAQSVELTMSALWLHENVVAGRRKPAMGEQ